MLLRELFIGCLLLGLSSSYRILVIVSSPMGSHHILGKGAADALHERGHNVTLVTSYPSSNVEYTEIVLPEIRALGDDLNIGFDFDNRSVVGGLTNFSQIFLPKMISTFMNSDKIKKLKEESKFDLVVLEYFVNEPLLGLAVAFDCPAVIISSLPMIPSLTSSTNNINQPAIVPNIMLSYDNQMTFLQRAKNSAVYFVEYLVDLFYTTPSQQSSYEKNFPVESAKVKYKELSEKISVAFVNSHPSVNYVRSLFPNAVEIGGYHIGKVESLPKDLQEILDNAKNGAIYFSLGSNLKSSKLDTVLRQNIMKALGSVKYTILWKFEEDLEGKPDNVIIKKWMPQESILAHKNVKLFISHGGLLSTMEAVHFGVPTIVIPIYADQPNNANAARLRGSSITLQYTNITDQSLSWAIKEITENPKYIQAAQNTKASFFDRPMAPRDTLNYYIEYAIRWNGAKHLHPPKLSFYKFYLLDVILIFVLIPTTLFVFIASCFCRACKRKLLKKKLKIN